MTSPLTAQEQQLIDLLFDNASEMYTRAMFNKLAQSAGYRNIGDAMSRSPVIIEAVRKRAEMEMMFAVPKAMEVMTEAMTGQSMSPIPLKAAESFLDRSGLGKIERVKAEGDVVGVVLLPAMNKVHDPAESDTGSEASLSPQEPDSPAGL